MARLSDASVAPDSGCTRAGVGYRGWGRNWWEVYGRDCCVPEFRDHVDTNLKNQNPIDFNEFIAKIKTGGV